MNKRIAGRLAGALGLLLTLCLLAGIGVTPVLAFPQMPHQFWGTVTIGGSAAPLGTVITARITGAPDATTTTGAGGSYNFMVPADDPDTPAKDGGVAGDPISFYVGTTLATGTATFQYGGITQRNLTIASPLTVTINQAAGQADPTSASPINFTVVFNATVTDFATGDVTLGGTAGAITATVTGSGATYNVAVTGMTSSGTVIATILAGVAHDALSNPNNASTSTDNTVTYNVPVGPTVTINQAAGQADPTSSSPINFTVVFSAVVTDFATGDVTLGGTAGATTATVTGSGATYNVAVSGMTGSGTVIATILAGVAHDALSNPNNASTSTDNTVTYNVALPGEQKLIGADESSGINYLSDYFCVTKYQAVKTGAITKFKVFANGSGQVKVAIYADDGSVPGARLSYNNTAQNVAAGWNTLSIPELNITQDTYYWLAVVSSRNSAITFNTGGTYTLKAATFSTFTFPNPAGEFVAPYGYHIVLAGWGSIVAPVVPDIPTRDCTRLTFRWNTSTGATKYWLQVNTSSGFEPGTMTFEDNNISATSREVTTGLTAGTTYYWKVKAGNTANDWSGWSSTGEMRCGGFVP